MEKEIKKLTNREDVKNKILQSWGNPTGDAKDISSILRTRLLQIHHTNFSDVLNIDFSEISQEYAKEIEEIEKSK